MAVAKLGPAKSLKLPSCKVHIFRDSDPGEHAALLIPYMGSQHSRPAQQKELSHFRIGEHHTILIGSFPVAWRVDCVLEKHCMQHLHEHGHNILLMLELLPRFIIGGLVVTAFAVIGDMLKPKSFAGLFGAAPSVALATLALSMSKHGMEFGHIEGRSLIFGACGLLIYSALAALLVKKLRLHALYAALAAIPAWFLAAFGLFYAFGGAA